LIVDGKISGAAAAGSGCPQGSVRACNGGVIIGDSEELSGRRTVAA
jgi:hypothetical protein